MIGTMIGNKNVSEINVSFVLKNTKYMINIYPKILAIVNGRNIEIIGYTSTFLRCNVSPTYRMMMKSSKIGNAYT